MAEIGHHASHEQFAPSELLEYVQLVDDEGFDHVLASDHFHPWSERQGESGFAWSWLGAAMERTSSFKWIPVALIRWSGSERLSEHRRERQQSIGLVTDQRCSQCNWCFQTGISIDDG